MSPTKPEEIQLQHKRAVQLVQEGFPCIKRTNHGEIPLSMKQCPVAQLDPTQEVVCVSSRGQMIPSDLITLQRLVEKGYNQKHRPLSAKKQKQQKTTQRTTTTNTEPNKTEDLWDPHYAATHNVHITRPSHDTWGIQKIIFIFCDDYLQRVYRLPWWHLRPDIQAAVQPIFDILDIQPNQVVRLLLASLPPETTIPVHCDSGYWVSRGHRVHVPVIVKEVDHVLFQCGRDNQETGDTSTQQPLPRVDVTPGHVFEMNNQARHAVSNCSTDYRVHLILDYVDEPPARPPILLQPGQGIRQTRRSIDLVQDEGKRPTPTFFILGAQKAGTTSLYEYMVQHPLVVRAKRRETHNLDWRWLEHNNNTATATLQQQQAHCLSFYHTEGLQLHPSCLTGDSTPSYLLDSRRVIPRLQRVFCHSTQGECKFFVMCRHPVARLDSHYHMVTSPEGTPQQLKTRGHGQWSDKTLHQVVMEDLQHMQACGLIPYWNIEKGEFNPELFHEFAGSNQEGVAWTLYLEGIPLHTGSHSPVSRGLYELQLRPWLAAFDRRHFLILKLEDMKQEGGVSKTMERVWDHLDLPPFAVEDESAKNTRSYTPMDEELRDYLERFYEPHNRRLAVLLGEEWDKVWT